jgi:putative ABC transport system substrate-binding protein
MRRREFLGVLGGTAAAWPGVAPAQPSPLPTIGFLHSGTRSSYGHLLAAIQQGLGETGFIEGATVRIEYRWAEDRFDRLPELARDLVQQNVSLIFAGGGEVSAIAAKGATSKIPIVFAIGADPVQHGLVASMNRPGANVTGTTFLVVQVRPKLVELVREILPQAKSIAVLANPNRAGYEQALQDVLGAAKRSGLAVVLLKAGSEREIDAAFSALSSSRVDAMVALSDPVYVNRRVQLAILAAAHKLPTIFSSRENIVAGGLICYGASLVEAARQAAIYAGRILKGEKPENLPVLQPTKFELVINLKTAKALGITVPATLLARADEVIE